MNAFFLILALGLAPSDAAVGGTDTQTKTMSVPQTLKASLPVVELDQALTSAKEKLSGTGKNQITNVFEKMGGTFGFTHFLESQPKQVQDSMESTVSQLRFDVFRPAADSLKTVVDSSLVEASDHELETCKSGSKSSAGTLSCELKAFLQLTKAVPEGVKELDPEAASVMAQATEKLQTIKSDVMSLRKQGDELGVERSIIGRFFRDAVSKGVKPRNFNLELKEKDLEAQSEKESVESGYAAQFMKEVETTGIIPALRPHGVRLPPVTGDLSFIKIKQNQNVNQNRTHKVSQQAFGHGAVNTIDMNTPAQGRFHYWSVINGLPMYYEDLTQHNEKAICVDGTNARMYYSPAVAAKKDNFHIYLQGGYFCFDTTSCVHRCQRFKEHCSTSFWWEKALKVSGMFNENKNKKMAGWHHTLTGYCSSDAWLGQTQLSNFDVWTGKKEGTAFFRGQEVFKAVLKANMKKGLCSSSGQLLLLSGASAGAIGLTNSIDHVGSFLKNMGCANVPAIIGVLDSALLVNGARATNSEWGGPAKVTFEEQTKRAWYNLKINYLYPPSLKKSLPLTGIAKEYAHSPWRMLIGEVRAPLVEKACAHLTPFDDDFAIAVTLENAHGPPFGPKQAVYFADYITKMERVLEKIDIQSPREGGYRSTVFAFRCFWHCVIENESMFHQRLSADVEDPQAMNTAFIDILNLFLDKKGIFAVDRCQYFDCTCMTMAPLQPASMLFGLPQFMTQADPKKYMEQGFNKQLKFPVHVGPELESGL